MYGQPLQSLLSKEITELKSVEILDSYPMPTFEESPCKSVRGDKYSVIDLKDAFLQILVEPECKKIAGHNHTRGIFPIQKIAIRNIDRTSNFSASPGEIIE